MGRSEVSATRENHHGQSFYRPLTWVLNEAIFRDKASGILKKELGVDEGVEKVKLEASELSALKQALALSNNHYRETGQEGEAWGYYTLTDRAQIAASQPQWQQGSAVEIPVFQVKNPTSRLQEKVVVGIYHNHPPVPEHFFDSFSISDFTSILYRPPEEPIPPMVATMMHGDGTAVELLLRTTNTPVLNREGYQKATEQGYDAADYKINLYVLACQDPSSLSADQQLILQQPEAQKIVSQMRQMISAVASKLQGHMEPRAAMYRAISLAAAKLTIYDMAQQYHVLYGVSKDPKHLGLIDIDPACRPLPGRRKVS